MAAIKAEGGITFAQDKKSAKFDGMPQSAIAAGCVDFVLHPGVIGRELARIRAHPYLATSSSSRTAQLVADGDPQLKNILHLLRTASDVDFSDYKPATLKRRILRRMALHKIGKLKGYVQFLQHHPAEVEALYEDILIKVTSFFRDPDAFEALRTEVFPSILKHRSAEEPVRVWVPGCSTGEEIYSHAISLLEFLGGRSAEISIQLFGTDLHQGSIEKARAGIYPESIASDVSPERLRRFFVRTEGGYRINKAIRNMCVFARHNLLQDSPFSRIDLISCRNVLIYLGQALQKRIMPIFHYALKPRGFLMLGGAEGIIGTASDLFELMDRKHKIYCRKSTASGLYLDFAASRHSIAEVKICEVLDNVLKFYSPAIRSGKVIIEKRYDSEHVIRGVPSEITQVFSNLVVNALEALAPEGRLKLHVLASRDWRNPTRRGVRVLVADNGPVFLGRTSAECLSHLPPQKVRRVPVWVYGSPVGLSINMAAGSECAAARSLGEAGPVLPCFSPTGKFCQCVIPLSRRTRARDI